MSTELATPAPSSGSRSEQELIRRIRLCPKLGSLQSINRALGELVQSEHCLNAQVADVIRRDPSLATRLLRIVNSVYAGLSTRLNNVEEAVFFLGLRQIRELALATPIIEELEQLQQSSAPRLPWPDLWRHSIGTATVTRELIACTPVGIDDDTDYLSGLLHNVGKVVLAYAFPDELRASLSLVAEDPADFARLERDQIGWDHAEIGAEYLRHHQLADEIVCAVRYHNHPDRSPRHRLLAAAVQVADYLVRQAGITGGFEQIPPDVADTWEQLPGMRVLCGAEGDQAKLTRAAIGNRVKRLPALLGRLA